MKNRIVFPLLVVFVLVANAMGQLSVRPEILTEADSLALYEYAHSHQHGKAVDAVWAKVLGINPEYPNPDLILPGQVIRLPLGMTYRAEEGGKDHMWRAAAEFTDVVLKPFFNGNYTTPKTPIPAPVKVRQSPGAAHQQHRESEKDFWGWLVFFFTLVILGLLWHFWGRGRAYPPFLKNPPTRDSSPEVIHAAAERAMRSAFGGGVQVRRDSIVQGTINGRQRMLNRNGSWVTERFRNERGFRATVIFPGNVERTVVSRWNCFNPVYSFTDARDFVGTFTPDNGSSEEIPAMSHEAARELGARVRTGTQTPATMVALLPTERVVPQSDSPERAPEPVYVEKIQFSLDKGLTLESGRLTVKDIKDLMSHAAKLMRSQAPKAAKQLGEKK